MQNLLCELCYAVDVCSNSFDCRTRKTSRIISLRRGLRMRSHAKKLSDLSKLIRYPPIFAIIEHAQKILLGLDFSLLHFVFYINFLWNFNLKQKDKFWKLILKLFQIPFFST